MLSPVSVVMGGAFSGASVLICSASAAAPHPTAATFSPPAGRRTEEAPPLSRVSLGKCAPYFLHTNRRESTSARSSFPSPRKRGEGGGSRMRGNPNRLSISKASTAADRCPIRSAGRAALPRRPAASSAAAPGSPRHPRHPSSPAARRAPPPSSRNSRCRPRPGPACGPRPKGLRPIRSR